MKAPRVPEPSSRLNTLIEEFLFHFSSFYLVKAEKITHADTAIPTNFFTSLFFIFTSNKLFDLKLK